MPVPAYEPFPDLEFCRKWQVELVDDVDETCRKLEAAGAKAMTNRADTPHAGASGARSYYEIKFRGPDNQEFDVTESGWITG